MSANVYDLARETFSKVKADWRGRLEVLDSSYSLDELVFAFAEAKQRGAGDLSYIEGILKNRAEQRRVEREKSVNQGQDAYEREAERYADIAHVHVLTDNASYEGEAPLVSEAEIANYATESLCWWLHQLACQQNAENVKRVRAELARRESSDA